MHYFSLKYLFSSFTKFVDFLTTGDCLLKLVAFFNSNELLYFYESKWLKTL